MSSQENERLQVEEINLGCSDDDTEHTYKVFVKTFLGYGANEALARHRRDLLLSQIKSGVRSERNQWPFSINNRKFLHGLERFDL